MIFTKKSPAFTNKKIALVFLLPLTGCYNIVVINVGVGNKSAAAIAAPFDLEAYCAALANHSLHLDMGAGQPKFEQESERLCESVAKKKGTP
jgi:hypothetical protein